MHDFLVELQKEYDLIAENKVDLLQPGLTADEVISACRDMGETMSTFRQATESIIRVNLYPMLDSIYDISENDEMALFETAQKISAYETRTDPGLALKIYEGLLGWARRIGNDAKILKYCYWCGITLHFFSPNECEKILAYFKEGASYKDRYFSFEDAETRKYIHRCLGNTSMVYYFLEQPELAREVDEVAFSFWNGLMFAGKDLDFPWLNYFMSCLTHRHAQLTGLVHENPDEETKDVLVKILETAITMHKLYRNHRELFSVFGGSRYDFILWEAQFLNGLISFEMLYENIEKKKAEFADDDFSPDAMYIKQDCSIYLVFYASTMQRLSDKKESIVTALATDTIEYFTRIPKSVNPRDVTAQLLNAAKHLSNVLNPIEQLDFVMEMTTYRHIPTYAHSIIVGKIASCLTRHIAEKYPESFIGFTDITEAGQVAGRIDELCKFAETGGLCHDIGKISYVINPYMHARGLTVEEYNIIKNHPVDGKMMLEREDDSLLNEGFADIILGHHKYYDNSDGYPESFDINASKHKAIIHIITASDSIDAATDSVGKTRAKAKSLAEVCAEIKEGAGKRYSPVVASILEDEAVIGELAGILDNERTAAYHTAYLHTWSNGHE
ncbi:MAG: HD domain-containing protein [Oscillospiraceae bacterium]|nr:HD domain-containing protein [Oscillospiraceae bacterium]